ncbi:MAG: class I SAM-dependent methyltransferase [Magnetococcales bacterium]|nr:class I SAM-dependent methyltransferase [Magnetococcales bacterium]
MDIRDLTYTYYIRRKQSRLPSMKGWQDGRVLEVGAGLENFAEQYPKSTYVTMDLDRNSAKTKNLFVQGNVLSLPFADGVFDHFIAYSILEHVPNPEVSLQELRRVCSKGGIISVPVLDEFPFIYDPVNWILKKMGKSWVHFGIGGFGHECVQYSKDWEKLLESCGYKVVAVEKDCGINFFEALEFFLFSIPFSYLDYGSAMEKSRKVLKPTKTRILLYKTLQKITTFFYKILDRFNLKTVGHVSYIYWVE